MSLGRRPARGLVKAFLGVGPLWAGPNHSGPVPAQPMDLKIEVEEFNIFYIHLIQITL